MSKRIDMINGSPVMVDEKTGTHYSTTAIYKNDYYSRPLGYEEIRSIAARIVSQKKAEYAHKYGQPKFVKLPNHIYSVLRCTDLIYIETLIDGHPDMLMGLIVCPTNSIQTFDEIEVF